MRLAGIVALAAALLAGDKKKPDPPAAPSAITAEMKLHVATVQRDYLMAVMNLKDAQEREKNAEAALAKALTDASKSCAGKAFDTAKLECAK